MRSLVRSAFVIARRDFTATVMSKTFIFFLAGPLFIIGISILFGSMGERMAQQDSRSTVAVIAKQGQFGVIEAARARLAKGFREGELPELVRFEPEEQIEAQATDLLGSGDKRILAVLTGDLTRPKLTGAIADNGSIRRQMTIILDEARQQRALAAASINLPPAEIELVKTSESAGSLAASRSLTARVGQGLLFMLTVLLAGMLLSNLVEEKSSKVIEVLAAAVPVDAIFVGKLFGMLAMSLVGIAVWSGGALLALQVWPPEGGSLPDPAVGWPAFSVLVLLYFSTNYLLLGAVFLGIGSQASSVREVQTLSMPVTIGQVLIFIFASFAVGPFNSLLGIAAAIFPFSSPMAMVARAAQTSEVSPHLLALLWQAGWAWLTVQLAARLFRRNVMKSGGGWAARMRRPKRV